MNEKIEVRNIDTKQNIRLKLDVIAHIGKIHPFIEKMSELAVDGWVLKSISLQYGEEYIAHFEKG